MKAAVSTTSVSARDGFEWWSHMVGDMIMPVSLKSPYSERFRGTATAIRLGDTDICGFSFSPMSARRSAAQIRRADPEDCFLFLVHGSPIGIAQRRNTALITTGAMALFDTSHPLDSEFHDEGRLSRVSLLRLPRSALPLPQDRADRLLGVPLPTRTVSGALLASYLTGLRARADAGEPAELRRLGNVAVDLAAAYLASAADSPAPLSPETRRQVLRARILAFVDRNVADPALGPATVAAHHHISVRLLHSLFHDQPETIGATIRRLRLERSRADLLDPALGHHGIGEIAGRWGFRHHADFTRAFRRAYGIPPSDFRRLGGGHGQSMSATPSKYVTSVSSSSAGGS
ncbi:AraC-like DNA-binding protein [Streptomyces sp. SAI-170]|uniref:helix-turn-helix domain-containing protein n=1 Tax=Streptomyces sp. SAI-170 TaxID=3377729 RepID=UPI003C7E6FF5